MARKFDIDRVLFVAHADYRADLFRKLPRRLLAALSSEIALHVLPNHQSVFPGNDAPSRAIMASMDWVINPTENNRRTAEVAANSARSAVRSAQLSTRDMLDSASDREVGWSAAHAARSAAYAASSAGYAERPTEWIEPEPWNSLSTATSAARCVESAAQSAESAGFAASSLDAISREVRPPAWHDQLRWSLATCQAAIGDWNDFWSSATVIALAKTIFAELAFDRMPILADALEEAGCDDVDLLVHLREPHAVFTRADRALLGPMCGSEIYSEDGQ